ncbi:MAG: hypothetical protein AAB540_02840, partial [Patescibacteria group bacterium]
AGFLLKVVFLGFWFCHKNQFLSGNAFYTEQAENPQLKHSAQPSAIWTELPHSGHFRLLITSFLFKLACSLASITGGGITSSKFF